jgi:hypothetical protein
MDEKAGSNGSVSTHCPSKRCGKTINIGIDSCLKGPDLKDGSVSGVTLRN